MIHRIDVATAPSASNGEAGVDPVGQALRHQIQELGVTVGPITTARVFLIDTDATAAQIDKAAADLLADPVVETASRTVATDKDPANHSRIEIHLKPGVMDPVAASTQSALSSTGLTVRQVRTGRAYLIDGVVPKDELQRIASRVLANGVIESVHFDRYIPDQFPATHDQPVVLKHVSLIKLDDDALKRLSREGHLFLSLPEMKAVQKYFRDRGSEPTDVELETIAQTWSEHCVHKTLKSAVDVEERDSTGKVTATRRYGNLIKETIFQSTVDLMKSRADGFCLSVFKDNAGVVAFDDTDAVCIKVETHNHPSAIEPYGGSATGIGGVIRDVLGTGLGAKPIASTDVFCVAPAGTKSIPKGVIHPKRVLQQVVAGVRDYGNRMGIPTVNGAVYFDDRYLGNPLVFCGCVGVIPRDKIEKAAKPGDAIVVVGGRTGRDGIHGATFSSAELTDSHADEFSHAVQIGNAITEKKTADVILMARDAGLFTAVTDCGAGGLSSAVGEMGEKLGASVHLDRVPLKYAGLRYDEIWISEAQERMVLSVPPGHVDALLKLARDEDVEATVIGTFGTPNRELILSHGKTEVGRLSMALLHDGIPMPTRKAVVSSDVGRALPAGNAAAGSARPASPGAVPETTGSFRDRLLKTLAHPNVASKHWIIRQYDHEVQGGSVIKPLIGPLQIGPSDAAVVRPKLTGTKGIAIGCGLAPHVTDPYAMTIAAIDEAIRNVVCVGTRFDQIALLDNFCWPSCDDEITMGTLVRSAEACRDAAIAFGTPFISGKDSLHNQFTNTETGDVIRIPATMLITAMGIVDDVRKCVTMDLKKPGSRLVLVSVADPADLAAAAKVHRAVSAAITGGKVRAAHDVSDGGTAAAVAEMCIASGLGVRMALPVDFVETPGRYVLEVESASFADEMQATLGAAGQAVPIGVVRVEASLVTASGEDVSAADLTAAWRGTLDW
jgi:phosphoribosylformylglycinamidine synthase